MCGLLGFLSNDGTAKEVRDDLAAALDLCRHRGPDEGGTLHDEDTVLGFRRLSIIDLDSSHQPLPYDDGRFWLLFNGEIYNYLELRERLVREHGAEFATDGDGEVILAAYKYLGEDCVSLLRGMFAFLIWDSQERVLFGARDWFGIKPLYTTTDSRGTFFGSEKKSLLALAQGPGGNGAELDTRSLQHYLTLQYVPEPASMHAGITRIESGTAFRQRPGGSLETWRYFRPAFPIRPVGVEERLYTEIREVLEDSVAKHMRADVTVGSFLSGGIDSTAIAALAKRHNPDLITFTTGFQREGYSEVDVAAESAAAIGVRHVVKTVSPQEMMDTLPLIVWYLDDPVADPALVPLYFVAREARKHVKVVLSGEGADELFGGYNIYREPSSLRALTSLPGPLRSALGSVSSRLPQGLRGKDLLRRGAIPLEERYYGNARIFRDDELGFLRSRDPEVSFRDVTDPLYAAIAGADDVTRMQYVDLFTWLRGDILVKADKMTMANSLELRVPFLDTEVFRIASTLPVNQRVTKEQTKVALRRALASVVPPHVLERRKLGFPVPIRHWLKDEMYDWARDIIDASGTEYLIERAAIRRMLDEHRAGPHDSSRKLWTVLVFMIWHGIFVERRIAPEVPATVYPVSL
ncbi:MAG TPA: asparagine synthase (glutamine-hydrolyzing) [Mycobacteriales bacterium]|nr:asparagine synthase (glutamine-hydrolyzing) [Mycobacteriales bacterium]